MNDCSKFVNLENRFFRIIPNKNHAQCSLFLSFSNENLNIPKQSNATVFIDKFLFFSKKIF